MKRIPVLAAVLLLFAMGGIASAQTATPTLTATPSTTPTPIGVLSCATPAPSQKQAMLYNGVLAGNAAAGSPTPIAQATAVPHVLIPANCGCQWVKIWAFGGTVGTDACYLTVGAPGVTTVPLTALGQPNAGAQIGEPIPAEAPGSSPVVFNQTSSPNWPSTQADWMGGEWDTECTSASMTLSWECVRPKP